MTPSEHRVSIRLTLTDSFAIPALLMISYLYRSPWCIMCLVLCVSLSFKMFPGSPRVPPPTTLLLVYVCHSFTSGTVVPCVLSSYILLYILLYMHFVPCLLSYACACPPTACACFPMPVPYLCVILSILVVVRCCPMVPVSHGACVPFAHCERSLPLRHIRLGRPGSW